MRKYHITFLEKPGERIATGMTLAAKDELQALELWRQRKPKATFLYIASPEMMAYKF